MIRKSIHRYAASCMAISVAFLSFSVPVFAQESSLSAEHKAVIAEHCQNSQLTIDQQQKRDAVSRINYGRAYDSLERQMSALAGRFAYNQIQASTTTQSLNDFKAAVARFRASYDRYSDRAAAAVKLHCQDNPEQFYHLVQSVRQDRATVNSDIIEVNQILGTYRQSVVEQKQTLQTSQEKL